MVSYSRKGLECMNELKAYVGEDYFFTIHKQGVFKLDIISYMITNTFYNGIKELRIIVKGEEDKPEVGLYLITKFGLYSYDPEECTHMNIFNTVNVTKIEIEIWTTKKRYNVSFHSTYKIEIEFGFDIFNIDNKVLESIENIIKNSCHDIFCRWNKYEISDIKIYADEEVPNFINKILEGMVESSYKKFK